MGNGKSDGHAPLDIVIVGASGDLASRKIVPALFSLFCQDLLPRDFRLFGLARSVLGHEGFRAKLAEHVTCRYVPGESCAERMAEFLSRCFYVSGQYGAPDAYLDLYQAMRSQGAAQSSNRLFYMAVPPDVFMDVARALGDAGMVNCGGAEDWSRIVIEKPFGRDRSSSDRLVMEMRKVFGEESTYRIDHYLGKEIVQNLMVLRFANLVFEPLWNREYVRDVRVIWKEPIGVGQRGGYFDRFGIIRDVMQNHLIQIVALLGMERPARLDADAVRNEKVRLLRAIPAVKRGEIVVGQYAGRGQQPAYDAEPLVPRGSRTPTYAAAILKIDNARWEGVPFFVEAGKALDARLNEVRIRFKAVPPIFGEGICALTPNELVIRIQPDEAIEMRIMNKVPGLKMDMQSTPLNLHYQAAFKTEIPDAYERLLLDVIQGDRSLFIRADELAAAWDVFTPVLGELESEQAAPVPYAFGSTGPAGAQELAARFGVER